MAAPRFVIDGEEWENSSPPRVHKPSLTCVVVFVFRYSAYHRGKVYFLFQAEQTELWVWHRRIVVCPTASTEAGECLPLSCLRTRHRSPQAWLPKTAALFVNCLAVIQASLHLAPGLASAVSSLEVFQNMPCFAESILRSYWSTRSQLTLFWFSQPCNDMKSGCGDGAALPQEVSA